MGTSTASEPSAGRPVRLAMRGITKRFAGTVAVDNVSLTVEEGEILGLIGQNGAGKSTLMKILAGDYHADEGCIEIDGVARAIKSPRDGLAAGIGIVYQELSLLPNLTVAENIALGHEGRRGPLVDDRAARADARRALALMGIEHIDPGTPVEKLSLAHQQLVEIAKVLSRDARVVVFDEPTAALALDDASRLMQGLRALRDRGLAVVFISHRYREVLDICDRCTVLRNGRVVGSVPTMSVGIRELVEMTLGRPEPAAAVGGGSAPARAPGEPGLEVECLTVGARVRGVSLLVRRGEIVGLCGLLGSGQNEAARAVYGDISGYSGHIRVAGASVDPRSPAEAARSGIGLLTENRRDEGLFPDLSVRSNITISSLPSLWARRFLPVISRSGEKSATDRLADQVGIAPRARNMSIKNLSGGNQQKALVARWLLTDCKVLVCVEPTRGVDVGARFDIYEQLRALADAGSALLVVTTEIDEARALCDRVLVMYRGRLAADLPIAEASEDRLFMAMQGDAGPAGAEREQA